MLGNQSKWIGALVGFIAGTIISILATMGLATCTVPGDIGTCTMMNGAVSAVTVQNIIQAIVTVASVWVFPANVKQPA